MVPRFLAIACAAVLGGVPAAAPSPSPAGASTVAAAPAPSATPPPYRPCPFAAAAQTVKVPPNTLPPPEPRDPAAPVVGGPGLATAGLAVPADAPPLPANLAARAWLVADLGSGAVLGACGPHERRAPASVQKLLLTAAVMPKLDPDQVVEVTAADLDFEEGSSAVGLITGGHYPVQTLWLGLLLVSGNDAANVLARLGGGSGGVPATMQEMNDLAHRLGARDTHAVTPHGLDAPGQFTSAYDLALIARADFAREDFRRYELTQSTQIPPQPPKDPRGFQIQNDNLLVYNYPGALGGKTGFTDAARHTYVGVAERNGRRLVVTILDAEVVPQRTWQQGAALLDWGFGVPDRAAVGRLVDPGELDAPASEGAGTGGSAAGRAGRGGRRSGPGAGGLSLATAATAVVVITLSVLGYRIVRRRRTEFVPPAVLPSRRVPTLGPPRGPLPPAGRRDGYRPRPGPRPGPPRDP